MLISGYTTYLNNLNYIRPVYDKLKNIFSDSNQFYLAVKERLEMSKSVQANLKELNNSDVYDTFATNSQVFDSLNTMKFYSTLSIVLCRRACEEELAINAGLSFSQIAELKEAQEHLSKRETDNLDEMERQIPYSVIPIQNLVKVQLESGLLYAQYIQDHAE